MAWCSGSASCITHMLRRSHRNGTLFHFFHLAHFLGDQNDGDDKCDAVRRRACKQDPIQPEEQRKDQNKRDQEDDLACHGEHEPFDRFSDGGEKVRGNKLYAVYDHHKEKDPHEADRKCEVCRFSGPEQGNDLTGEELEEDETDG